MNNFGRKIKITIGSMHFSNADLEIRFEVPFDDDYKPNQSRVDILNLSKTTIAHIKKGTSINIQAGYGSDVGVLASGKISKVLNKKDGVDKVTSVYMIEGDDYTEIKVTSKTADPAEKYTKGKKKGQSKKQAMKISFKAGTDGKTIINRLVKVLGIKLGAPIKLTRNKVYKKGYVVTGLVQNNLDEVIRDCGSVMYHRKGKLIIRPLKQGTDEKFLLEESTGLLESPEAFEEDGVKGYKGKCMLQHRITTASIIKIKSKTANGSYRAKKGKHIADASDFITEFEIV